MFELENEHVNITPLVDVALVLVAALLLCVGTSQAISIAASEAGSSAPSSPQPSGTVAISQRGLTWQGNAILLDELVNQIRQLKSSSTGNIIVLVTASSDTTFNHAIEVVKTLQLAGVQIQAVEE